MRVTLFLCGDVMIGRGIDQVLPHPSDPRLYEPWVKSAVDYVKFAEQASGPIPRPVDASYVWGDALAELERVRPDARIVNLETSVTRSDDVWPEKGINYRMHPDHVSCLGAARIDCCSLANNHVLDWGHRGLLETLETLGRAGVKTAGAGRDLDEAERPAIIGLPTGQRVIVFACGTLSSGIPPAWAAAPNRPGVKLLPDLSDATAQELARCVAAHDRPGDIVVASIHWGTNWGYEVPPEQVHVAHRLVEAGADIVYGHSSHHPRPIEVFEGRLILYGCGDFLNDYEGIPGHEEYRGDLTLMYFPTLEAATGQLVEMTLVPLQIRNFRLRRATLRDACWLGERLSGISAGIGFRVVPDDGAPLVRARLTDVPLSPLTPGPGGESGSRRTA
jgi:poly-gamma-glutamate capsule biosynthesis protein CapA/YwtB (metallophosphatase superfamily)